MACSLAGTGHDGRRKVRLPESVSRVLFEKRVYVDLGLRNWKQDLVRRREGLVAPRQVVLVGSTLLGTDSNQIRAALALGCELEQTLGENRIAKLYLRECRRQRLGRRRRECTGPSGGVNQVDRLHRLSQLVHRLCLDQIDL